MIAYCGQTRSRKLIDRLSREGVGECTVRGELPPRRWPFFFDNGAFRDWNAGRPFDALAFEADLCRMELKGLRPDFVVAPDLVARGVESLAESIRWIPRLSGLPIYLAVQDGMTASSVEPHVLEFAGLFVGGSLPWKLDTGAAWVDFAHAHGKPCHVGRVGTARRVRWALEIGADSIDSCLPLWSTGKADAFLGALRPTGQRSMFGGGA